MNRTTRDSAVLLQIDGTVEMLAQEEDSGNGEHPAGSACKHIMHRSLTFSQGCVAPLQWSTSSPSAIPIPYGYSS
jgi:hypothetical protein